MEQYTLEYVNKYGDTIARDYFSDLIEAEEFAKNLIETYKTEETEVVALYITDEDGVEWFCANSDNNFWEIEFNNCISEYYEDGIDVRTGNIWSY